MYLEVEDCQTGLHLCHDLGGGEATLVQGSPGRSHIRPAPAVRQSHKVNLILLGQLGQALLKKHENIYISSADSGCDLDRDKKSHACSRLWL